MTKVSLFLSMTPEVEVVRDEFCSHCSIRKRKLECSGVRLIVN